MAQNNYQPDDKAIAEREKHLEEFGYNVFTIPPDLIKYEFKTDSWLEILTQPVVARLQDLHSQIDYQDRKDYTSEIFSFQHFIYVAQGRTAEAYYWKVDNKKGKTIITNLLFPSTRQHIIMNRMKPVECPVVHIYDSNTQDVFRGNLDCAQLRDKLSETDNNIAYIYIEAENNASGGYPVSMSNIKEIKNIISGYDIKMVLDGTRLVENCIMIQQHEAGYTDKPVLEILQEFCSYFDSMTSSLAKDFGIDCGGIIATDNERLYYRAKDIVSIYGSGISVTGKAMVNAAMKDWDFVEKMSRRRVAQANRIHQALIENNLPVISPSSGHCVLLDVEKCMDVSHYKYPIASFTAYIYAQTGIRSGMHLSGSMKKYFKPFYVRLAIPLCMTDEDVDAMIIALVDALGNIPQLSDMEKTSAFPGLTGMVQAKYKPVPICSSSEDVLANAQN